MTRIQNDQRVQLTNEQLQRAARAAGTSPEAFAELLQAAQAKTENKESLVSQVARLLAAGKLDPQVAVMLSLAGGTPEGDLIDLTLPGLTGQTLAGQTPGLPVPGAAKAQPIPAAYLKAAGPAPASGTALERFHTLKPHFLQAEQETGVPWQIQAAQWALETGWGSATPRDSATGQESFNLFGIKGRGPAGSVESATTEFVNGRMVRTVDRFRAYHSYTESIVEHARLLTTDYYKPAHAAGKNLKAWTDALGPQRLGYATDPDYSRKLWQIIRDNGWDK